jgi:chromosome partitioning protein
MPVISLLNQKGGVGKTTLSVHLAMALWECPRPGAKVILTNARVLLVDADPQGSALDWSAQRESPAPFRVIGLPTSKLHQEIGPMSRDYDYVVIDGPPGSSKITRSAVVASDLVVIPVQPSPFDVWAAEEVESIVSECMTVKPVLAYFLINRQFPNTTLAKEVGEELGKRAFPAFRSAIRNRTEYAKAARAGLTALETEPAGPGANDIRTWALAVCSALDHRRSEAKA